MIFIKNRNQEVFVPSKWQIFASESFLSKLDLFIQILTWVQTCHHDVGLIKRLIITSLKGEEDFGAEMGKSVRLRIFINHRWIFRETVRVNVGKVKVFDLGHIFRKCDLQLAVLKQCESVYKVIICTEFPVAADKEFKEVIGKVAGLLFVVESEVLSVEPRQSEFGK